MRTPIVDTYTRLRLRRLVAGLSRAQLARAIRRSPGWVGRVEHGLTISREDAERIAAVFGVPAGKLFTTAGDPLRRAVA